MSEKETFADPERSSSSATVILVLSVTKLKLSMMVPEIKSRQDWCRGDGA